MEIRIGHIVIGVVLFFALVGLILSIEKIDPGYAGVVYSASGGVEENVLSQGWHFVAPWKKVTEYPVSTETVYLTKAKRDGSDEDESFDISTKDGKNVNVDVVYSFHMNPDKLPYIYTKFRGQDADLVSKGFMKDRLKEAIQEVSTSYDVMQVYGEKRSELNSRVYDQFKESLAEHGIVIETFNFASIRPDKDSMKAIQEKVDAKQSLETMKVQKEQAQVQAEKKKIEAEGLAKAKLIEAEAEAKANKMIRESINKDLVDFKFTEKWDGKLPKVTGGGNILDLKGLK